MPSSRNIFRLRQFVADLSQALDCISDPPSLRQTGQQLLGALVRHDDWLPARYARAHPQR